MWAPMSLVLGFASFLTATPGSEAFQWTSTLQDNAYVAACVNKTTNLQWSFTRDNGETVHSIRWYFHGESPEKLIAVHTANYFFVVPEFSERVQFLNNGGLVMSQLSVNDSGKYSVQISVSNHTNVVADYTRAAHLEVSDGLRLVQERTAVLDPKTDSRHVTLKCGPIVNQSQQTPDVVWKTPSGESGSWKFERGHFFLMLQNPVKGGKYSCVLPRNAHAKSCLPPESPGKAALVVDENKARLTLLEAENTDMKAALETATRRVAFHARLSGGRRVSSGHPVILDTVLLNEGGAYNGTTGSFTVPYTGTYFLIATTADASSSSSDYGNMRMMADNQWLCNAYSKYVNYYETSTCHVTVHLREGQRVLLQSVSNGYFHSTFTAFSGFLLHADE